MYGFAKYIFWIFFSFPFFGFAQTWIASGAKSAALADASVCLNDQWSIFNNIGAVSFYDKTNIVLSLQNRYGQNGINTISAGAVGKWKNIYNCLTINRLGDDFFSKTALGFGISHRIQNASIGLKAYYLQMTGQGLGISSNLVLEMGGVMKLTPKFWIGANMYNFTRTKIASFQDERIPSIIKVGFCYEFSDKLLLAVQAQKDLDFDTKIGVGLQYWLIPMIVVRTGVISQTWQQTYGCGLKLGKYQVDYAFQHHPFLNMSHQISLSLQLN